MSDRLTDTEVIALASASFEGQFAPGEGSQWDIYLPGFSAGFAAGAARTAIGTEPVFGAGNGLASDVHLVVAQRDAARAENAALRERIAELEIRLRGERDVRRTYINDLQARIDKALALVDEWRKAETRSRRGGKSIEHARDGFDCAAELRAALAPDAGPDERCRCGHTRRDHNKAGCHALNYGSGCEVHACSCRAFITPAGPAETEDTDDERR